MATVITMFSLARSHIQSLKPFRNQMVTAAKPAVIQLIGLLV